MAEHRFCRQSDVRRRLDNAMNCFFVANRSCLLGFLCTSMVRETVNARLKLCAYTYLCTRLELTGDDDLSAVTVVNESVPRRKVNSGTHRRVPSVFIMYSFEKIYVRTTTRPRFREISSKQHRCPLGTVTCTLVRSARLLSKHRSSRNPILTAYLS
jgi:hypothetical protein